MRLEDKRLQEFLQQMSDLAKPLQGTEYEYQSIQSFVLAHGQIYDPQPLPKGIRRGMPRRCFDNAFRLARRKKLIYVEGYAIGVIIEVHHAWCVEPGSRKVIDPTWEKIGSAYFGVPINLEFRKQQCCALDNWKDHWPILRKETKPSEWQVKEKDQ